MPYQLRGGRGNALAVGPVEDPLSRAIQAFLQAGSGAYGMVRGIRQENADRTRRDRLDIEAAVRQAAQDDREERRWQVGLAETRDARDERRTERAQARKWQLDDKRAEEEARIRQEMRDAGVAPVPSLGGGTTYTQVRPSQDMLKAAAQQHLQVKALREQAEALGVPNATTLSPGGLAVAVQERLAQRKMDAEFQDFQRRERFSATGGGTANPSRGDNKDEMPLRKEFNAEIARHSQIAPALAKIQESAKLGTGQGDMGIIYGFMKMQDPGSTVREGEYASAQNSAGVPEQVRQAYNRALSGEKLSPDTRAKFLSAADALVRTERAAARQTITRYAGLAVRYGMPADAIVYDPYDPVLGPYQTGKPAAARRPMSAVVQGVK